MKCQALNFLVINQSCDYFITAYDNYIKTNQHLIRVIIILKICV